MSFLIYEVEDRDYSWVVYGICMDGRGTWDA